MNNPTVIRIDRDLVDEIKQTVEDRTHIQTSYDGAIRHIYGEYKRLTTESAVLPQTKHNRKSPQSAANATVSA